MAAGLEERFTEQAKRIIRSEMDRKGMTYGTLAEALGAMGAEETDEATLRTRLSRGRFSAAFFLTCLKAIGAKSIEVG